MRQKPGEADKCRCSTRLGEHVFARFSENIGVFDTIDQKMFKLKMRACKKILITLEIEYAYLTLIHFGFLEFSNNPPAMLNNG
jgi:hypothetical protein